MTMLFIKEVESCTIWTIHYLVVLKVGTPFFRLQGLAIQNVFR